MLPEKKRVLVTGGSGGIGQRLVRLFIDAGSRVMVADRNEPIDNTGAEYVQIDFSNPSAVEQLGLSLRDSPPDILVNLAGVVDFGHFEVTESNRLQTIMQVNLLSPMQLTRQLLPAMLMRGSGQVVNIGSVLGSIGLPYFTAYSASKAGLKSFSESLRRELSGKGISVTHVAPRAVKTSMNEGAIDRFNQKSGSMQDDPERVAGIIFKALSKDTPLVTIGFPERFYVKVNALLPALVDRSLIRNRQVAEQVLAAQ